MMGAHLGLHLKNGRKTKFRQLRVGPDIAIGQQMFFCYNAANIIPIMQIFQ